MGFFSWKCAVSRQSIPAECVEPTNVVVLLPDGTTEQGIYDGYGRVSGFDIFDALREQLGTDDYDAIDANVKLIKAKFFRPEIHTFATVPTSETCPDQGYFYPRKGSWNSPKYK